MASARAQKAIAILDIVNITGYSARLVVAKDNADSNSDCIRMTDAWQPTGQAWRVTRSDARPLDAGTSRATIFPRVRSTAIRVSALEGSHIEFSWGLS
jgi:hypothetical protein